MVVLITLELPLNPAPWFIFPLAMEYVMAESIPLLGCALLFPLTSPPLTAVLRLPMSSNVYSNCWPNTGVP